MEDTFDMAALAKHRAVLSSPPVATLGDVLRADRSRSFLQSLWRISRARTGPGRLTLGEYLKYGTVENSLPDLLRYAGVAVQADLHAACNDRDWFALTKNKLVFEMLMAGAGLPVARTMAVFDRKGRGSGVTVLKTRPALEQFLSDRKRYPLFCKPVTGVYSLGTFALSAPKGGKVRVNDKKDKPLADIVDFIAGYGSKGYLFQQRLRPEKSVAEMTGSSGAVSLRFLVLLDDAGPKMEACVAKLPAAGEVADNFWRDGAVLCAVSTESGTIFRAVANKDGRLATVENHPDTGAAVKGYSFADFPKARDMVVEAAGLLSGIRTQSWDVAITRDGPRLLEVNFGGDLSLVQVSHGRGVLSKSYCNHLRANGYRGKLPR